jgi:subfamily B ATP-binding cassette protein MsbA
LLAGVAFAVLSGVGLPAMVHTVLPIFFGHEEEASPKVVAVARALFGEDYQGKLLLVACFGLPVIFLLRGVCAFFNRYLVNRGGFLFLEGLRQQVFARLQELPLSFYQQHKSGDLVSRLVNDTEQLRTLVINLSNDIVKQPLVLVAAVGYLCYHSIVERNALFAIVALLSVPLCVIPIRLITRRLVKRAKAVARQSGDLAAVVTEALQSPLEIQAYNLQPQQNQRFRARVREILRLSMKTVKYQAVIAPVIEFVSACGFMAALYFGVRSGIDFATFSALGVALFMAYEPAKKLSGLHAMIKARMASLERLEQVLDAEDTVASPPFPRPLPRETGAIRFENVSFVYPTRTTNGPPALSNIEVTIHPGETVALVGASGAGKSTFALLLPRFYDPTNGRVCLGGVDLRELDKAALRSRIAIVPQTPALFNTTIAENIRLGRADATDAEVRAAAEQACAAEFIATLPQGFDTPVGERGATVSGGQRQRIAIARAFLKDAPILILDEATSALDSASEVMVRQALEQLMRGRTTVMIAHRFSSIAFAERVLLFQEGRIIGDGSPASLRKTNAAYGRMCELQRLP